MGQIQRLTRGQIKPYNSLPSIDWAHPLADGLATYCYDAGGFIIDLVRGCFLTTVACSGSQQFQFGRQLAIPNAGYGYMPPFPTGHTGPFGSAAPYSAWLATFFTGATGPSFPDSACVTIQDANNTEDTFFGFNTTPATDPSFPNNVACLFSNSNAANFNVTKTIGQFQTWGVSVPTVNSAFQYANGNVDNQSYTGSTIWTSDTTAQIMYNTASINSGQTFGNGINGFIPGFGMWSRALKQADFVQLNQDPWCFLIYPEDEMLNQLVGTSVAPPSTISLRGAQLSMMGIG